MVHDREQACNGVFRDDTTESEAYKADVRDPVDLKHMAMLNKPLLVGQALPPAVHGDIYTANVQGTLKRCVYLDRVN